MWNGKLSRQKRQFLQLGDIGENQDTTTDVTTTISTTLKTTKIPKRKVLGVK